MPDNLFPLIGALAEQTDNSEDLGKGGDTTGAFENGDEERVVQEIESLCMNCEEQVIQYLSSCYFFLTLKE
jgi:zinc finger protein